MTALTLLQSFISLREPIETTAQQVFIYWIAPMFFVSVSFLLGWTMARMVKV